MQDIVSISFFYPMLFGALTIITVVLILSICGVMKSRNGNMTFKDMFTLSSNNAKEITIDTTDKMKNMHTEVIQKLPEPYEHELHRLNTDMKSTSERVERLEHMTQELNEKVDIFLKKMIELERRK